MGVKEIKVPLEGTEIGLNLETSRFLKEDGGDRQ
jgi:hypothetical protein